MTRLNALQELSQLIRALTRQTLVSDGISLSDTIQAELQIAPYASALLRPPRPRSWLPTRIPDSFDLDYESGRRRIRTLYASHNASAPVCGVPSPVLTRIFTASGTFREWRGVLVLTHVCRAWRRVALGTPQLWADAVWSLSQRTAPASAHDSDSGARFEKLLSVFLARSGETHPVHVRMVRVACQQHVWRAVVPHLSKLALLSVVVQTEEEVVGVLETLRSAGMPSLEVFELVGGRIPHMSTFEQLTPWRDDDFPRLRELKILSAIFSRVTSVRSIRAVHLVSWSEDSAYVGGLSRCAETLESLTLEPRRRRRSTLDPLELEYLDRPRLHLPKVRKVSITGNAKHVKEAFASLTLAQDIHIDLTFWDKAPVPHDIYALLPTYIPGTPAPSPVDSLQFRLGSTLNVVVRCYAGDEERLHVEQTVYSSSVLHVTIWAFRSESPSITELAVNLTSVAMFSGPFAMLEPFVRLMRSLWHLRRLELLGATRRNVKFRILEAFLRHLGQPAALNPDSLTVAWAVQLEYGVGAAVDELEQLIEVLTAHHVTSESGARGLARLELCVTTDLDLDRYKSYFRVRDFSPNRIWSARVAKRFLRRLEPLADEVVILGDWEKYAADIEEDDEWYRGGGSVWKEAIAKGSCWDWGPGGEVVVTRNRIEGHVCRSCQ